MNTNRLINAISLFRDYEEDIPVGTILCFLHLCDNDEATVSQVDTRFKLGKSRASRNMRNLTDRARPGKAGIDVASYRPDPADFRVALFSLNDRGKELKAKLEAIMKQ
ncbi:MULTISPECIES: hypothetical protein [unclassified Marinobacter]|uniref:hypothetical protein n=1 Tax=unclassified Marinobacter TaxID=83889 RepID=UPI0012683FEF|nr:MULTISPECIES: hypothetical protein [unclassified Marinobacter]QFS87565.1 hypothetical protein FIV08_12100 [Marinobacter sp. THAF197a]QFT51350.1 hypothetical protein FIU96_12015 [Marinobacter sp. THAF39]